MSWTSDTASFLAEELPRCRAGGLTRSILAQASFFSPPPSRYGAEEQEAGFLAPAIRGDQVGALESTEATGGSDITGAVQCAAAEAGDSWVVSGEKMYITNRTIADFVVALVRTRPDGGPNGMSLLLIPTDTPGFAVKQTLRKLGLHTLSTGWLAFDRCRIPKTSTIGKPHLRYYYHTQNPLEERLVGGVASRWHLATSSCRIPLIMCGIAWHMADACPACRRSGTRSPRWPQKIELARAFVHAVCERFCDGHVGAKRICMTKVRLIEIVQRVVERGIQLFGANGFLEGSWVTRAYRDVWVLSLGGGTSEVMTDLAASHFRL